MTPEQICVILYVHVNEWLVSETPIWGKVSAKRNRIVDCG